MDLSISYIYGEAWTFAKKNIVPFLVYSLIVGVIGIAVASCCMPSGFWSTWLDAVQGNTHAAERLTQMQTLNPMQLLQYLVSAILVVPLYNGILGVCRGIRKFDFDSVKLPASVYCKFVLGLVLYVLIILVGAIFLLVPGIYLGIRFSQAGYYLIEHHDASIKQAMAWSWDSTRGHVLELFGLGLVGLVALIGAMIPCIILVAVLALFGPVGIAIGVIAIVVVSFIAQLVLYFANGMVYVTLCEK